MEIIYPFGAFNHFKNDLWKTCMRWKTNAIDYTDKLPLAQGIKFTV
jgi:hypothetical protein